MAPTTSSLAALVLGACLWASRAASPAPGNLGDATAAFEAAGCVAEACMVPNPCDGTKPKSGFDNFECIVNNLVVAVEQSGSNVTKGYKGLLETDAEPITTPYSEAGLCPVNVHWHLGSEHLSVGEYDENGVGPSHAGHRRAADGSVRQGFQCLHYDENDPIYTEPYDWKYCTNMEVGQSYEVHWPHSKGGDCGTIHQYQTPFYDGVFCNAGKLAPSTQAAIGVQSQVFVIVNDEQYYHDGLFNGMILDNNTFGTDMAFYTGSTTGTSRSNEICSKYSPITWQVDRKCHKISASSFDKMCKDMLAQHDDMSGDVHPHGSRELVADIFAANNHQDGGHSAPGRDRRAAAGESCACLEERVCDAAAAEESASASASGSGSAIAAVTAEPTDAATSPAMVPADPSVPATQAVTSAPTAAATAAATVAAAIEVADPDSGSGSGSGTTVADGSGASEDSAVAASNNDDDDDFNGGEIVGIVALTLLGFGILIALPFGDVNMGKKPEASGDAVEGSGDAAGVAQTNV